MEQPKKPEDATATATAADVAEEIRRLGQSFSALGRTMFREGRSLTAELLRSTRGIVDRAREEIERLSGERPAK